MNIQRGVSIQVYETTQPPAMVGHMGLNGFQETKPLQGGKFLNPQP
jgi:hypothetical protein